MKNQEHKDWTTTDYYFLSGNCRHGMIDENTLASGNMDIMVSGEGKVFAIQERGKMDIREVYLKTAYFDSKKRVLSFLK